MWLSADTFQVMCPESSFDELLNLVEMNHQLACDPEAGGCGKLYYIHHILSTPPHVFTTGIYLFFWFFSVFCLNARVNWMSKELLFLFIVDIAEDLNYLFAYASFSFGLAEYL